MGKKEIKGTYIYKRGPNKGKKRASKVLKYKKNFKIYPKGNNVLLGGEGSGGCLFSSPVRYFGTLKTSKNVGPTCNDTNVGPTCNENKGWAYLKLYKCWAYLQ